MIMQALLDHYSTGGWSCINAFIGFNSTRVSSRNPGKLYCLPFWTDFNPCEATGSCSVGY